MSVAEKTEILVLIGYSFPMFNRVIDKKLFEKMNKLKKVYIQSPQATEIQNILESDLLTNQSGLSRVEYKDLGYWNQFYIPNEWSQIGAKEFTTIRVGKH